MPCHKETSLRCTRLHPVLMAVSMTLVTMSASTMAASGRDCRADGPCCTSAPGFDQDLGLLERVEDLAVQELIAQLTVEALDDAVLTSPPWPVSASAATRSAGLGRIDYRPPRIRSKTNASARARTTPRMICQFTCSEALGDAEACSVPVGCADDEVSPPTCAT